MRSVGENMSEGVPELSVKNPYVVEEGMKDEPIKDNQIEDAELIYKSPRLFRRSLIHKTWKLFKKDQPKDEKESKFNRSLKEK